MTNLTPYQQTMLNTWGQHGRAEFELKDPDAAIATMSDNPYILGISLGQLLYGREAVHTFYARDFLPKIPADFSRVPVAQIVGADHIAEEFLVRFTHTVEMPWMAPGVRPTGRKVDIVMVAFVGFNGDKMAYEHLMWDHAALLTQLGVTTEPAVGVSTKSAAELLRLVTPNR